MSGNTDCAVAGRKLAGARHHPDRPYGDPRVTPHLDNGRHFLRTTEKKYELVVYAMVDSLILHGGYANIRLESFLFTEQAFGSNIAGAGSARRSRCCWTGSTNVCELASVRTSWLP